MKILAFLLFVFFLVSCWANREIINNIDNTSTWDYSTGETTNTWNDSESNTWQTTSTWNLSDNTGTIMNTFQTKPLENWDIVAVMKTTNGTITIKLFTDIVPVTTTNFIALAEKWYYNNLIFHRVIKDFMIQWGDPEGTGMWWESIYGWNFDDEFSDKLSNIPYSIAMANSWENTNGSQFFINKWNNTFLDFDKEPSTSKHDVFWQVVEWTWTVDTISKVKTNEKDKPEKDVKIISVEIKQYENGQLKDYKEDVNAKVEEIKAKMESEKAAKKTKAVENGDTVSVNYTWTFENWEKFDSSYDRGEPISFKVWAGQMIKGFDAAVVWMKIGDKKSITLTPDQAYWEYDENNKQVVPKSQLKSFEDAGIKLEVWAVLPTQVWSFKVIAVDDDNVTIDTNHPMAGKTLKFDVELMDIK